MDEDDIPTLVEPDQPQTDAKTVPLTIISGFLGAGKSTLIRRILSERHGYRIAVIMNDFGDTADIEAKTINVASPDDPNTEGLGSEEVLELANGCLCCSIKDSGVAAIEKLMQRKGAFDHILLETTGLADPGPIASMFWQNEEYSMGLGRDIHLDGVVCVVDAVFGQQQMEEDHSADGIGESLRRQIACADVVLLNKTDLVSGEKLASIEGQISHLNPTAIIHRTVRGDVDLRHLMGIQAYAARTIPIASSHDHCEDDDCREEHDHAPRHYELRGISSLQVACPVLTASALSALDEWIRTVLWESRLPGDDSSTSSITILRCKGMFRDDSGTTHILQGVRNLYDITEFDAAGAEMGVPDEGKLVLIGKGLDEQVRASLVSVLNERF